MTARRIRVLIAEEDDAARDELAMLVRAEPSLELADAVCFAQCGLVAAGIGFGRIRLDAGEARRRGARSRHSGRRRERGARHKALLAQDARARIVCRG